MTINNVPAYADEYNFIVAREVEGEFWFWGAWNDERRADEVAEEIGGKVFLNF